MKKRGIKPKSTTLVVQNEATEEEVAELVDSLDEENDDDSPVPFNSKEPKLTSKQVAAALIKTEGRVTQAAKLLNCNFKTVYRSIERDARLQRLKEEIDESNLDKAENSLMKMIQKGNLTAIIFFLKCKGKRRGWIEEEKTITHIDKPIIFNYNLTQNNTSDSISRRN